jgi:hypothetical protein
MYSALGLETISPTKVFSQLLREKIEAPVGKESGKK